MEAEIQSAEAVRQQLAILIESEPFRNAERQQRFLTYVVEEELAGRGGRLSQFAIAMDVFDREDGFDPAIDSVVRVEARRLRTKLAEHYADLASADELVISLPKGGYRVSINSPVGGKVLEAPTVASRDDLPTVAVLPLDNLSGDPKEEYFGDGMTEDIITDLSKIAGLHVISRHSTFVYKGRSVPARDIGEDLGARYLVEGSIRRSGDMVRVTAQLIDAEIDNHIWAERYDRKLTDVFTVQDEVSALIVGALDVKVTEAERQRFGQNGTRNQNAYDLVLKGMEQFYTFEPDKVRSATGLFARAASDDSEYANAFAWHGRALIYSAISGLVDNPEAAIATAVDQGKVAEVKDSSLAHAHAVLGWALLWKGEVRDAIDETAQAIDLDPNFADGYLWHAMALCSSGDGGLSLETIAKGIKLNPHFGVTYLHAAALAHFALGEFDQTLSECRRARGRNPNFLPGHLLEIATLGHLGRTDEGHAVLSSAHKIDPDRASILSRFFSEASLRVRYTEGLRAVIDSATLD